MEPLGTPLVSVVIPVRDGAGVIATALESILAQDYAGAIEVIVADGGSTDGTRAVVHAIAERDRRVRLIENERLVTPSGLNAAITASRGDVIVRCDAQAVLPAGYVARAVRLLDETGADVVGGSQLARGSGFLHRAIAIAMTTPAGTGGARFRVGGAPGPTDTVYLGVFRRTALERVGLFDESLIRNQDYELNHRIRTSDGIVYFHPELAVEYTPRPNLGALFSQYRQYGDWKRRMLRRHPESLRARQLVPPLFVLGLVAALVMLATPWRPIGVAYVAAYLAVLLGTALIEVVRRRDTAALASPIALATLHVAWGAGFLLSDGESPEPVVPTLGP